tara:strand:- start:22845 stop:24863 length:2019 start_codon:yes stop_codon:yes gene_type:complete
MAKTTNELAKSHSPYLLQHADNPVNWVEWSSEAFEKAEKENKLVLVSIGYSACHWCHVMEHESFEDEEVAKIMNENFVCIKVDREERPDVDQVYMNAVQLMTQQGGWPLNCFTLPDGRPIYGGTYFQKENWKQVLKNLWNTYLEQPEKVEEYATKLKEGVQLSEMIQTQSIQSDFDLDELQQLVSRWKRNFDFDHGGEDRAPKFPLPNNYEFLLKYGEIYKDTTVLNHVHKSLNKMAQGGIYDQIGGGFARYSVDAHWKVPHFEKMLYDNGQLLSLYAQAFQHQSSLEYKRVIKQTVNWLDREMLDAKNGGYFSALDADSEGVEGKFYTWSNKELEEILDKDDYSLVSDIYNVNEKGYWENGQYILLRDQSLEHYAEQKNEEQQKLLKRIEEVDSSLLSIRSKRVRPGLDNKKITSWNALVIKGLADAGAALGNNDYVEKARDCADWIMNNMWSSTERKLFRIKNADDSLINGFLDDYSNTIDAFIQLYERTFEVKWLNFAKELMEVSIELFSDEESGFFFYTEKNTELIARKMEINDNVIPSSNSVMAKNLWTLGVFFSNEVYLERSRQMLSNIYSSMSSYGSGYSNWAQFALRFQKEFKELAIVGGDSLTHLKKFNRTYIPNAVIAGGTEENIPFLEQRLGEKTAFYICQNRSCKAPIYDFDEMMQSFIN